MMLLLITVKLSIVPLPMKTFSELKTVKLDSNKFIAHAHSEEISLVKLKSLIAKTFMMLL
jgi:hypothetical protein